MGGRARVRESPLRLEEYPVKNRRGFLSGLLSAGVAGGIADRLPEQQQNPVTPPPQDKRQTTDAGTEKRILEENEKDIKKKVEKLYDLATELKTEVEKTDSSKVLSLNLVRKAEEIEKLARDIKNRSKG